MRKGFAVNDTSRKESGKPKRAGRPPRTGKKPSTGRLELRLTEQELARWQRAADRAGVTLSGFVRACVEAKIA